MTPDAYPDPRWRIEFEKLFSSSITENDKATAWGVCVCVVVVVCGLKNEIKLIDPIFQFIIFVRVQKLENPN